jgi:hypothetical protein
MSKATPTPYYETYRLVNEEIRPGTSQSDQLMVLRPGGAAVSVPFTVGSKVYAVPLTELDVVANGTTGAPEVTTPAGDKVVILGKSLNLMV